MSKSADQQRRRKHAKAEAEGRTMRYHTMGRTAAEKAAHKIEYKRQQRLKAAEREGRVLVPHHRNRPPLHDAHVADYVRHKERTRLHDAHVRRYLKLQTSRHAKAEYYRRNRETGQCLKKAKRVAIHDAYVINKLQAMGIPRAECTPELIYLKHEQLALRRLVLELKSAAKKTFKEEHERLTKHP